MKLNFKIKFKNENKIQISFLIINFKRLKEKMLLEKNAQKPVLKFGDSVNGNRIWKCYNKIIPRGKHNKPLAFERSIL